MYNLYIDFFFFFVPNRLVWTNWEKFNGAQDNPGDSIDFIIPTLTTTAVTGEAVGSISDKMGIPTGVPGLVINALPYRCYQKIYNDWFRDENLQNSVLLSTDNGPDLPSEYTLLKRGKRHDYFTSALPWPQKGTAVSLPLGTSATVKTDAGPGVYQGIYSTTQSAVKGLYADGSGKLNLDSVTRTHGMYADLSTATAATINQLRQAFQVQSLL